MAIDPQRIGRVQSITPQRDWHPLGALIFQFRVAFSGFNPTLAELNGCTERMLVRGSLEGIVFMKLENGFFFFNFKGLCCQRETVQLLSADFTPHFSSQILCLENQQ